ncbi:hypothetical protein C943_03309 [Mariniradius saccharolyticus AK6]|uniref:Uncharacterized protein n=1 Tax=Mariniradius saccharolyticus AK6 TaxID=1239962 RepID=M7Y1K1_9BACT|nr:hypothetical protein [Mariniradius saccharolyticus]EMS34622.1 hypothetical protein C943_03309 [Mariniradius saccharolyticus AK6]
MGSKKQIKEAREKIAVAGKRVGQMASVVQGINFLIDKKAVVIDGNTVYLYRELWGSDPKTPDAWMKNMYIYMRLQQLCEEGQTIYFRNIETDELIGRYESV